jgi:hypothetical protein
MIQAQMALWAELIDLQTLKTSYRNIGSRSVSGAVILSAAIR